MPKYAKQYVSGAGKKMTGRTLFVAIGAVLFLMGPVFGEEKQLTFEELIKPITPREIEEMKQRGKRQQWQKGLNQLGRFQGIANERGGAYVLDTKMGHVWFLCSGGSIKYIGRVFPLKEIGKKIIEVP